MTSPAERYARFRTEAEQQRSSAELTAFTARYPFTLDDFQLAAGRALEDGSSVLVAAPTGAGKTVVGEFAVHLALARGHKVFYTAPIKALSNQKFGELVDWLGAERVGLLTGDTAIRPEAEVVVMTTEVLRNMLYADSDLLDGLGFVVMDEVHYLADRLRGPVWEEVIIHLDRAVQLVSLSATVSNAEEFAAMGGYNDNEDNVIARTPAKNAMNLENLKQSVMELVNPKVGGGAISRRHSTDAPIG